MFVSNIRSSFGVADRGLLKRSEQTKVGVGGSGVGVVDGR